MFQYVLLGREVHTDGTKLYHVLDCSDRSIDVLSESEMQTCMKMKLAISEVTCSGASFEVSDRVDHQVKGTGVVLKTAICAIKNAKGIYGVECYNPETGEKSYRVCTGRGIFHIVDGLYKYSYKEGTFQGNPKTSLVATYIPDEQKRVALLELHLFTCNYDETKLYEQYSYFVLRGTKSSNYIGDCELVYITSTKPAVHIPHMRDMYRKDAFSFLEQGRKVILG